MGQQFQVDGETQEHRGDKTIKQLKQELGIPETDVIVVDEGDGAHVMGNQDKVKHIPDNATVSSVPAGGMMTG